MYFTEAGTVTSSSFIANTVSATVETKGAALLFKKTAFLKDCLFKGDASSTAALHSEGGWSLTSVHFLGRSNENTGLANICNQAFSLTNGQINTTCYASGGKTCSVLCDSNSGRAPGASLTCVGSGDSVTFSGTSTCNFCLAGQYAHPSAPSQCYDCPAGFISASPDAMACGRCAVGSYADQNRSTVCKTCPAGHFSDHTPSAGTAHCTFCGAGTYRPNIGAGSCVRCVATQHCTGNVSEPELCPLGFYCPIDSSTQRPDGTKLPCTRTGSFCPPGSVAQTVCERGFVCPNASTRVACAATEYCPPNSTAETKMLCPAGHFCSTDAKHKFACLGGYYCPQGTTNMTQCPEGFSCPFDFDAARPTGQKVPCNDSHTFCPTGTASPLNVLSGHYSTPPNSVLKTGQAPCETGVAYCRKGQAIPCAQCAAGRFTAVSCTASSDTTCLTCTDGFVSSVLGSFQCNACPAGTRSTIQHTSCTACEQGTYSLGGTASCVGCEPGRATSVDGTQPCAECPAGMFGNASNQVSCMMCEPGTTYQNTTGAIICKTCSLCPAGQQIVGQASRQQDNQCSSCVAGTFSNATNAAKCSPCEIGNFQDEPGKISCKACASCAAGRRSTGQCSLQQDQRCEDCLQGRFSAAASNACISCAAGKREDGMRTSCVGCQAGTFSKIGAANCTSCLAGMSQTTTQQGTCNLCQMGTYANAGASVCKSCPAGHSTAIEGAKKCSKCAAPVLFQAQTGKSACTKCTDHSEQVKGTASACRCTVGYVATTFTKPRINGSSTRHAETCAECLAGVECDWTDISSHANAWRDLVHAKPGFWQCPQWLGSSARGKSSSSGGCGSRKKKKVTSEVANPMMRKCPHRTIAGVAPPCTGGYNWSSCVSTAYEGPLCAACAADHYKNSSEHCVPCGNSQATGIGVILGLLAFVVLIIARCCFCGTKKTTPSPEAKTDSSGNKKDDRWTTLVANATWAFSIYNRVVGEKLKIMLTYGQLLNALTQPEATGTEWPLAFVEFIDSLGTIVNLNLFALARSACTFGTTFLSESLVAASTQLTVIAVGLLIVVVYQRAGKSTAQLRQALVFFVFLVYTGLNNTLCAFFKCVRLEDDALHLSGDLRVVCYEGTHMSYVAVAAVFVIVFSLGVPCALVVILYRAHRAGRLYATTADDADDETPTPSKEMAYLGSMFTRYQREAFWFEAVHLVFKLWFSGVLVVLGNTELQADATSGVVGDTRAANVLQLVCAMLALLLYLLVSGLCQPYVDYGDDVQWMVSLSALLLCAFLAMLRQAAFARMLGVTDATLGAVLITFGLVPLILGTGRLVAAAGAESGLRCFRKKKNALVKVMPAGNTRDNAEEDKQDVYEELSRDELVTRLREAERKATGLSSSSRNTTTTKEKQKGRLKHRSSIAERLHQRKHLTDEEHSHIILAEHEAEVQQSRRQLDLDQQASAARGQRKRFKKRLKHLLKALLQTFGDMPEEAIVQAIDKDADGEISYTELFQCMQKKCMNSGNANAKKLSAADVQLILKEMDRDASGTVGVTELLEVIRTARVGHRREGETISSRTTRSAAAAGEEKVGKASKESLSGGAGQIDDDGWQAH